MSKQEQAPPGPAVPPGDHAESDNDPGLGTRTAAAPSKALDARPLSTATLSELLALSDPATLQGPEDAQRRVQAIATCFRTHHDPRGLFATVYRLITDRAVESIAAGAYAHPDWARRLVTEFARRYLANLHGHLDGSGVSGSWARYYALAQDSGRSRARTLGVAIAVHLMVDLPHVLHGIGSAAEQRADFVVFGDILLEVFPQLVAEVRADYATDVTELLRGFCFGAWVDRLVAQEGSVTGFVYQSIRLKAWRDGQNLGTFPAAVVDLDIRTAWGLADTALANLERAGLL